MTQTCMDVAWRSIPQYIRFMGRPPFRFANPSMAQCHTRRPPLFIVNRLQWTGTLKAG